MARKVVTEIEETVGEPKTRRVAAAKEQTPEDPNMARQETRVASLPPPMEPEAPRTGIVEEKQFRVRSAPALVQLAGQVFSLKPGKVVSDTTYDLGALRAQGVVLEEIAG